MGEDVRRGAVAVLATCNLNQWALDFDGNLARVVASCAAARAAGARFRTGPELELTGYGCEDHFLELETTAFAWESLARLLAGPATLGLLVDVGLPMLHRGVRYNVRAFCLNQRVLLIRPKTALADDGNYREGRWFTPFVAQRGLESAPLPPCVSAVAGQTCAPFGVAILECSDGTIAAESCEELFAPVSPLVAASLQGVDIIANGSGSHHQLRKLQVRVDLICGATAKCGGAYLYANQRGCDGGRLYFDGCALIVTNGDCVAQGSQFSLHDVEMVIAAVDLDDIRSKRAASMSRGLQAAAVPAVPLPRISVDWRLCGASVGCAAPMPTVPRPVRYALPAEEVGLGPACWLWDFLRRSGASGYFLPLSGGADSAATAAIVGVMCGLVYTHAAAAIAREAQGGDGRRDSRSTSAATEDTDALVLADLRRIVRDPTFTPSSPRVIANAVLHTAFLGTANSSTATRARATLLASQVGAFHSYAAIDAAVAAVLWVFAAYISLGALPRFGSCGGSPTEDVALQNLQARLRMVLSYLLAQLLPWLRARTRREGGGGGGGFLLVLGSANVDESLRGYMTKYDCSSADVNPIGGVSKRDLATFLAWAAVDRGYTALTDILHAPPTAELRPMVVSGGGGEGGGAPNRGHRGPLLLPPTVGLSFGSAAAWAQGEGLVLPEPALVAAAEAAEQAEVAAGAAAATAATSASTALAAAGASGGGSLLPPPPPLSDHSQHDEDDMGMSYAELSTFGTLRKVARCGPFSMFRKLLEPRAGAPWSGLPPRVIGVKVKRFFFYYALNRHKMTTLTPSYHAESYSPDDNRFDLRPFLYPTSWARAFAAIDAEVAAREAAEAAVTPVSVGTVV